MSETRTVHFVTHVLQKLGQDRGVSYDAPRDTKS